MVPAPQVVLSLSMLLFSLLFAFNALSLHRSSAAASTVARRDVLGPVSEILIANEVVAPDGYTRSATLANGVFPAPLIQANKNDEFSIQLFNGLTDDTMALETSIHWHGIFQHKSNWADGTSFISQCPIRQEQAFKHKFTAVGQTGTYWYHSHYETQYCDGLRGPLVIYDPEDPLAHLYDVDDESTVITLSDWFHSSSVPLSQLFAPVFGDSTLINGKGRYPGGPPVPLSVIDVQPGLRYRFRLVSMFCGVPVNFTIDGHRMTIIEADGNEVHPVEVDSLPILAGQRYSVIVKADQPVGNYWIRALAIQPNATFDGGLNMAILRYAGAAAEDPKSVAGPYELPFDEGDLHPFTDPSAPGTPGIGKADVNLQITPGFNAGIYSLNGVPFVNPPTPVLLQILSGARHASELLPNGSVYDLPPNKVIEISFPNIHVAPGLPHPVHLHGHSFSVVRVAGSDATNFVDPVRRDVVSLGSSPNDNVTIRFVTDNPGPWFLHCHIDWHLHHGFAAVMAEAPDVAAQQQSEVVPTDWKQLCQN